MLCLKVAAPADFVIKFIIVLLQQFNGLCVSHTAEIRSSHMLQSFKKALVHKLIEELHFLRCMLQYIADNILHHALCQFHIILKISKSDFRLDHPELSRMAGCVGILSTECWSECVNVAECHSKCLAIQLTADSQVRWFAEEIL